MGEYFMRLIAFRSVALTAVLCCAMLFSACGTAAPAPGTPPAPSSAAQGNASSLAAPSAASSAPSAAQATETLLAQAQALTPHLVACLSSDGNGGIAAPDTNTAMCFLLTLPRFTDSSRDINSYSAAHPYRESWHMTPERLYCFPYAETERIAWELFWLAPSAISFGEGFVTRNEALQQYESGLEFGVGGTFSCKDPVASASADASQILVSFTLTDNSGFAGEPGWREYGTYTATFDCLSENDQAFLRFCGATTGA